jgi:hypothetical protein
MEGRYFFRKTWAAGFDAVATSSWHQGYDFLNIFAENIGEKMMFFTQNTEKL